MKKLNSQTGFTLVELMISLGVSVLLVAAVYATYTLQRKNTSAQDQVVVMQQNLRSGLMMISQEVKMAGYDPRLIALDRSCGVDGDGLNMAPGIHTATATTLGFSMDLDQDGKCSSDNENITYSLYTGGDGVQKLGRKNPLANQAVAENVEHIEFWYTLDNGTQTTSPTTLQMNQIRRVTLSMLVRVGQADPNYVNTTVYAPASGADWAVNGAAVGDAPNDSFRRRLVITNFSCRNMGT